MFRFMCLYVYVCICKYISISVCICRCIHVTLKWRRDYRACLLIQMLNWWQWLFKPLTAEVVEKKDIYSLFTGVTSLFCVISFEMQGIQFVRGYSLFPLEIKPTASLNFQNLAELYLIQRYIHLSEQECLLKARFREYGRCGINLCIFFGIFIDL